MNYTNGNLHVNELLFYLYRLGVTLILCYIKTDISLNAVFVYYFPVNFIIIGDRTNFHIHDKEFFFSNKLNGECFFYTDIYFN